MKKISKIIIVFCLFLFFAPSVQAANLGQKLKGYFLLQLENNGYVWYVNPSNSNRYLIKDSTAATELINQFAVKVGVGELKKIPTGVSQIDKQYYDYSADTDKDGLVDALEKVIGTDYKKADTDGDKKNDSTELKNSYDPTSKKTQKIMASKNLIKKYAGKILISADNKQIWYFNPKDNKKYYLFDASVALNVLGHLALGIKDADLNQITKKEIIIPAEKIVYWGLDEAIKNPTKVFFLHLTSQGYSEVPQSVFTFTNLKELYLGSNKIVNLPASIGNLKKITKLDLSYNNLSALPAEIGNLTEMTNLVLAGNYQLKELPSSIVNLKKLSLLDLYNTKIHQVPEELKNIKYLHFPPVDGICKLKLSISENNGFAGGNIFACENDQGSRTGVFLATPPFGLADAPFLYLNSKGETLCSVGGMPGPETTATSTVACQYSESICDEYLCPIQ